MHILKKSPKLVAFQKQGYGKVGFFPTSKNSSFYSQHIYPLSREEKRSSDIKGHSAHTAGNNSTDLVK